MNKDLGTTTSSTLSNQPTGDQRVSNAAPTPTPTPTPGPWRVAPSSAYRGSEINIDAGPNGTGGFICVAGHRGDLEAEANAALIAEAGTVLYETRFTPRQLLNHLREASNRLDIAKVQSAKLLAALRSARESMTALDFDLDYIDSVIAAASMESRS